MDLLAFCDPYVTLLQSPFVLLASVIYLFLGSLRIIKCRVLHLFVLSTATTNTTTLKYEEVHCVIFCIYLFPLKLYCTLFLFTTGHNKVFVPFLHRAVLVVTVVIVDTKAKQRQQQWQQLNHHTACPMCTHRAVRKRDLWVPRK